jgi:hypothetical protein
MLKLHAGVSKKVGLPGYSSASASCTIEAELDSSLLQDHEGFQVVVRRAYQSCEQAVEDQIARLSSDDRNASQPQEIVEVRTSPVISGAPVTRIPGAQMMTNSAEQPVTNRQARTYFKALKCVHRPTDQPTSPAPGPSHPFQSPSFHASVHPQRIGA